MHKVMQRGTGREIHIFFYVKFILFIAFHVTGAL